MPALPFYRTTTDPHSVTRAWGGSPPRLPSRRRSGWYMRARADGTICSGWISDASYRLRELAETDRAVVSFRVYEPVSPVLRRREGTEFAEGRCHFYASRYHSCSLTAQLLPAFK